MKISVKIEGRLFKVEIGDLNARPILATVEGETFEVWPESELPTPVEPEPSKAVPPTSTIRPDTVNGANSSAVLAPMPGVIVSIAVQSGAVVTTGQELCTLEAMKMKNVIHAPRDGQIAVLRITVGQHVRHRQLLMEYAHS